MLYYDVTQSPFGPLWLISNQEGLSFVIRGKEEADVFLVIQSQTGLLPRKNSRRLLLWRKALNAYFSGEKRGLDGTISFMVGTPFQQKVWRKLLKIPYGQVRSYRWIAEQLSLSGASRAVGNACGKNPLPIVIPCHRVIRQNRLLGGYTGGIHIKTKLLSIEGLLVNGRGRLKSEGMIKASIPTKRGGLC